MEDRLVDIELKVISLEDTVQQLNELVYAQQRQLDELRALCRLLIQQQEEGGAAAMPAHERPPHY
ncbi:SlyX family protein [Yanghanlia caeni]|uniref:SlyX family protein n=1 Tax=Yanghanlia caeni TaxID=3064283 RepID=A0ABU1D2T2_9BURK|nr:SlyX family protein [Alcaligenaceae bacterium LG-2]HZH57171.1 SlyX family protein [Burkholderiaceae bacterium]